MSVMGREKITAITVGYGKGENHSNHSRLWDGRKSQQLQSGMGREKITAVTMLILTCIYLEDTQLLLCACHTFPKDWT
jgi:hypothetical protein